MKKLLVSFLLFIVLFSTDLVFSQTEVKERRVISLVKCQTQSNISISVADVKCTAAACLHNQRGANISPGLFELLRLAGVPNFEGIGTGLKDMFTGAITSTGCFKVFDRDVMEAIQKELALSGKQINTKSADYIILANITSINFERKGGNLGLGVIPILSAISVQKQTAQLTMDVRLVKVETGEVAFTKTYTAESGKTTYGIGGGGAAHGVGFGGTLSALSGTAMEEVARDIILRASFDIANFLVPNLVQEIKMEVTKEHKNQE